MDTTTISFETDLFASEQDEFFVLELTVLSPTGEDASSVDTNLPNVFFRSRQTFTIIDTTGKLVRNFYVSIWIMLYIKGIIYLKTHVL